MWGNLADAVKEGAPRWKQTFGLDGPIFSSFFRTEQAMRDFARGMHGFGMLTSPKVVSAFDLSRFRRMADLGGATGYLVIAACEKYPQLHGTVFDLPQVAALAREQVELSKARNRIEIVAGDFFEDELPAADLYALGRILHDWREDKIDLLLRKILGAPAGGRRIAAGGEAIERRRRGAGAGKHAIAQHAGGDGRPRAHARRIFASAAGGGVRGSGRAADGHSAGCDPGCEGITPLVSL